MDSYRWQGRKVTAEHPQKRIFQHLKQIIPTDSVASKGQNIFWLIEMSIYIVLKAAITSYLLFCTKLVKHLFLRWLNALDILYYRLYIFAPRISLQGLFLISFEEISYAVISAKFNKKVMEFLKFWVVWMRSWCFVEVYRIPVHLIYNKFSVTLFVLCFSRLQSINVSKF